MNQVKPSTYQVGNASKAYSDGKKRDVSMLTDGIALLALFFPCKVTDGEEDQKSLSSMTADSFNLATHTLKIRNSGAFIDIDEVWSQHGICQFQLIFL